VRDIRAIVIYYSRSGHTRTVAEEIARAFGRADIEEIRDTAKRGGLFGWFRSARDGMKKLSTPLASPGRNVADYDLVIVGGPIWAGGLSSPVRSWFQAHAGELRHVAVFLTHGGSKRDEVLAMMAEVSGHVPLAELSVKERELGTPAASARIAAFASALRQAITAGDLRSTPAQSLSQPQPA
jgi:flavodoxin